MDILSTGIGTVLFLILFFIFIKAAVKAGLREHENEKMGKIRNSENNKSE